MGRGLGNLAACLEDVFMSSEQLSLTITLVLGGIRFEEVKRR